MTATVPKSRRVQLPFRGTRMYNRSASRQHQRNHVERGTHHVDPTLNLLTPDSSSPSSAPASACTDGTNISGTRQHIRHDQRRRLRVDRHQPARPVLSARAAAGRRATAEPPPAQPTKQLRQLSKRWHWRRSADFGSRHSPEVQVLYPTSGQVSLVSHQREGAGAKCLHCDTRVQTLASEVARVAASSAAAEFSNGTCQATESGASPASPYMFGLRRSLLLLEKRLSKSKSSYLPAQVQRTEAQRLGGFADMLPAHYGQSPAQGTCHANSAPRRSERYRRNVKSSALPGVRLR